MPNRRINVGHFCKQTRKQGPFLKLFGPMNLGHKPHRLYGTAMSRWKLLCGVRYRIIFRVKQRRKFTIFFSATRFYIRFVYIIRAFRRTRRSFMEGGQKLSSRLRRENLFWIVLNRCCCLLINLFS